MGNQRDISEELGKMTCAGIHELIDWQIVQYRRAVDKHRLDLSKAVGRCVAWQEAEQDFNAHDRRVMAEQSRIEYCGLFCPERNKCLTALHFLHTKKTEPLYRVG
jgi:hypothetical protein